MRRAAAVVAFLLAACASYPPNAPLAHYDRAYGYRFTNLASTAEDDETIVILSFSGGGTRAAALAYGVLGELANTKTARGTLLDEVDAISSVSGGSFTAAAYVLAGHMPIESFERDFLRHNVQRDLLHATLNPRNWPRLLSLHFSRIDLASEYYDARLFGGKTFADIPRRRPYLLINATELDIGSRFEFTQEQFDPICSDLQPMKVARAVAASSAFPVLLTAVTLRNHAGTCKYEEPEWVANAMDDKFVNPLRFRTATELRAYEDARRRFIQLIDGGVADNIGLRGPLRALSSADPNFSILRLMNRRRVKRIAIITVDAERPSNLSVDKRGRVPMLPEVLTAIANAPMANYSFDTLELVRESIARWNRDQEDASDKLAPITFYRVQVALASLPDADRKIFDEMPTSFALTDAEIDALLAIGPRLLHESGDFQRLVADLR